MDLGFILINSLWASGAALLVAVWQEISDTRIPPIEWIPISENEPELKKLKDHFREELGLYLQPVFLVFS